MVSDAEQRDARETDIHKPRARAKTGRAGCDRKLRRDLAPRANRFANPFSRSSSRQTCREARVLRRQPHHARRLTLNVGVWRRFSVECRKRPENSSTTSATLRDVGPPAESRACSGPPQPCACSRAPPMKRTQEAAVGIASHCRRGDAVRDGDRFSRRRPGYRSIRERLNPR